jgi:hypothetical protein
VTGGRREGDKRRLRTVGGRRPGVGGGVEGTLRIRTELLAGFRARGRGRVIGVLDAWRGRGNCLGCVFGGGRDRFGGNRGSVRLWDWFE